ncbi:M48 family metalloprotease [Thiomicrorhabdus sp. zzn3]|uniref:M48 family metalloprotease n=1 Tax=Thiomicrorhabdus sp. zzn3 TaxID=3039775 RepID=UPI002436FA0C|nr:M48 family metalloprotease [Thiomicrorhabdus sp. zzn3]MDG6778463.1 M48 family metalloprotease [Thiomicrorhabdus sp. zzn3]
MNHSAIASPPHLFVVVPILLIIALCTPNKANATDSLPDLGSSDLVEYTPEKEQALGRAFKAELHTHYNIVSDPDITGYVRRIGHKIAQYSNDDRHFSFYVIDHPEINAFAGPDGVIGIHTGLLQAVKSEDELASVIAHEIAHVTQNHLSRRYELQSGTNLTHLASFIAAILIGMHDTSAGMATLMGSMGADLQQQLKHSRIHEAEADYAGIDYLYQSGYNPYAMGDFFGRLAMEYQNNEFKPLEILMTHPVTEHRLAEAKNRAETYPPLIFEHDTETLTLIKLRLQAKTGVRDATLQEKPLNDAQQCYQNTVNTLFNYSDKLSHQNKPTDCLTRIIRNHPLQPLYRTLQLETFNQAKKTKKKDALKLAEIANDLFPQNASVLIQYAKLLEKYNKPKKAIDLLEGQVDKLLYKQKVYKQLSRLYADMDDLAYAYFYEALGQFEIGNLKKTEIFLEKAEEISNSDHKDLNNKILIFRTEYSNLLKQKSKLKTS